LPHPQPPRLHTTATATSASSDRTSDIRCTPLREGEKSGRKMTQAPRARHTCRASSTVSADSWFLTGPAQLAGSRDVRDPGPVPRVSEVAAKGSCALEQQPQLENQNGPAHNGQ